MKRTKIINLFAGPGAGKSTIASGLFHEMKKRHIKCDAPYEFPKELAWNESNKEIKDQLYVIANQHRGIVRSYGIVDYIILDSPLLLSLAYRDNYTSEYPANLYGENFERMMLDIHNKYDNINIIIINNIDFTKNFLFNDINANNILINIINLTIVFNFSSSLI